MYVRLYIKTCPRLGYMYFVDSSILGLFFVCCNILFLLSLSFFFLSDQFKMATGGHYM